MRVGVFGGTFNPPHLGHLVCAQEAYVQLSLDRVLFIPTSTPPHKPMPDDPGPEHRLELCRLAVRGDDERFEVCDLEVRRAGTSYTVDTLEELSTQVPERELFLILGADVAAGLPGWREPERILSVARLALAGRSGTSEADVRGALSRVGGSERATFFDMPMVDISSTELRTRVAKGLPLRYLVPDGVAEYIDRHGLYRDGAAA